MRHLPIRRSWVVDPNPEPRSLSTGVFDWKTQIFHLNVFSGSKNWRWRGGNNNLSILRKENGKRKRYDERARCFNNWENDNCITPISPFVQRIWVCFPALHFAAGSPARTMSPGNLLVPSRSQMYLFFTCHSEENIILNGKFWLPEPDISSLSIECSSESSMSKRFNQTQAPGIVQKWLHVILVTTACLSGIGLCAKIPTIFRRQNKLGICEGKLG